MTQQLNRRTFLKVFRHLVVNRKAAYTVAGAGIPPERKDLKCWKSALKTALRVARNKLGVDYGLLFEVSPTGHQHAHILLVKKSGKEKFDRVYHHDLKDIRNIYLHVLYRMATKQKEP